MTKTYSLDSINHGISARFAFPYIISTHCIARCPSLAKSSMHLSPQSFFFQKKFSDFVITILFIWIAFSVLGHFEGFHTFFRINSRNWTQVSQVQRRLELHLADLKFLGQPNCLWLKKTDAKTIGNRKRGCAWCFSRCSHCLRKSAHHKVQISVVVCRHYFKSEKIFNIYFFLGRGAREVGKHLLFRQWGDEWAPTHRSSSRKILKQTKSVFTKE